MLQFMARTPVGAVADVTFELIVLAGEDAAAVDGVQPEPVRAHGRVAEEDEGGRALRQDAVGAVEQR